MIIAEQKPLEEIKRMIAGYKKVLLVGCGTCTTICMAGGEKEVGILASSLRMAFKLEGKEIELIETTIQRQCEWEFIDKLKDKSLQVDSILSMGCGGSSQGKCEIDPEIPCGWQLIYDRLKALGRLEALEEIKPPKDWSSSRDGGSRKVVREDILLDLP